MFEFLAALGLVAWIVIGVGMTAIVIALAVESEGWATFFAFLIVAGLAYLNYEGTKAFLSSPGAWLTVALWFGVYILIGLVFSFIKWTIYSRKAANAFRKMTDAEKEHAVKWSHVGSFNAIRVDKHPDTGKFEFKIVRDKLNGRVVSWTSWWPFHAVALIFDDLIQMIVDLVVRYTGRVFQTITNWAFADINK